MLMNFGMNSSEQTTKTYSCSPSWSAFLAAGLWFILIDIYGNSFDQSPAKQLTLTWFLLYNKTCACVCDQQQSDLNQLTS